MDSGNGNKKVEPAVGSWTMGAVKGRRSDRIQPTRSSARLRRQGLPFEVFYNELLRTKILEYTIFSGGDKKETRKNACSMRLVGKAWNETVIKLLHRHHEPLFRLNNYSDIGGGHLKGFCKTFASSTPINDSIVPFSLEVVYFEEDILIDLYNLLAHCGSGLVELTANMIMQGRQCKSQFPNWSLPRLAKLNVVITKLDGQEEGVTFGQDGGETVGSALIKALREAATFNAEFNMTLEFEPLSTRRAQLARQNMFESMDIPATVNNLTLSGDFLNGDVEVLSRKHLPNLTSLTLSVASALLKNGLFFRILDIYRATLKSLNIQDFDDEPAHPTIIRFPIMEKLEEISSSSEYLQLEPGHISLAMSFPKLHTLRLQNQTDAMFEKWTGVSKFTFVTAVDFSLNVLHLNMETMQSVNFAFPNVQKLDLGFSANETSGLNYLFREMTQLTDLKLNYWGGEADVNSYFWDAILTGVSIETVVESRENPGIWDRLNINGEDVLGSIKNLQELTSLTLHRSTFCRFGKLLPLISDVTFERTLLQMPKLRKLYLYGSFVVTSEMAEVWRNGGRLLECQRIRDSF